MERDLTRCAKCKVEGELFEVPALGRAHESKMFCRAHYLERMGWKEVPEVEVVPEEDFVDDSSMPEVAEEVELEKKDKKR